MVNLKCSNLTGIESWRYGLIFQSASRQTSRIPCLDLYRLPCVFIPDISSKFFSIIILQSVGCRRLGYLLWWSNSQSIKVILILSQLSLVTFATLYFITTSISLSIRCLSRSSSLIVVVVDLVEVECSSIVFNYNKSVDLKVSFGWQVVIGKWMKWLLDFFKYNK